MTVMDRVIALAEFALSIGHLARMDQSVVGVKGSILSCPNQAQLITRKGIRWGGQRDADIAETLKAWLVIPGWFIRIPRSWTIVLPNI